MIELPRENHPSHLHFDFFFCPLIQLADIRGNNKKDTLLKFLILQLEESNPDALNFTGELKSVTKAAACK